jgi:riboflavin kinase/FMN adenylyltransferase
LPPALIPLLDPRDALRPTAIALGSFDGLHAGHRRVIAAISGRTGSTSDQDGTAADTSARTQSRQTQTGSPQTGQTQIRDTPAETERAATGRPPHPEPTRPAPLAPPPQAGVSAAAAATPHSLCNPTDPVATVVSFWPHPRELLHGEMRLRLDLPSEKLELLEPLGIRQLVLVPFDHALAALSPEAFVEQVLVGQLQARRVAVGCNFRFGAQRRGDGDTLVRLGARHGITVTVVPVLEVDGERMSSSRIRRALAAGEIAAATRLLLRPYRFSGRVVRGRGLGRQLGWPTANLRVDGRKFLPLEGVYAAWVWIEGQGSAALPAVMNLGPQPTVDPQSPSAVEVHLLEGQPQLEGAWLTVEPVQLLRRQQRFADLAELSRRIGLDAREAQELLRQNGPAGPPPGSPPP